MDDPIRLLLTNAAAAGLVALLAWAASRTVRRQAVVHGLWLLALARLVMPPIAPLPLVPGWVGLALTLSPASPIVVPIPPPTGNLSPAEASSPRSPGGSGGTATAVTPVPVARSIARVMAVSVPTLRPAVPAPPARPP